VNADVTRRLARLYPRAWRARYEEEFVALLDARGDLTWSDTIDILGAAGREWGRTIARWPTREPADDLRTLRRQSWIDLVVITIAAGLIDIVARSAAGLFHEWTASGGPFALLFVQAAVAVRCAFTYRRSTGRVLRVGPRELAMWLALVLGAAIIAHIDPQRSSLVLNSWWLHVSSRPGFGVYLSVSFLMQSTPAAAARAQRLRELLERRRRASVPPNPLGLR
jgi:hypothetical protein